jgi:hypothetical protein
MTIYRPTPGALDGRLWQHLARVREDRLSAADIARKFDTPISLVEPSLAPAITARVLERKRGGVGGRVWLYGVGPMFDRVAPEEPAPPPARERPSPFPTNPAPRKKRSLPKPLADDALQVVEEGVPVPAAKPRGQRTNWALLFERLAKAGLCSSPLPIEHLGAGKAAAKKHGTEATRTYVVAPISDTHFRIWRTA